MREWLEILGVAAAIGALVIIIVLIVVRCFCCKNRKERVETNEEISSARERLRPGTPKFHHLSLHHLDRDGSKKTNYYVLRRGQSPAASIFSWNENPSLVTDAVENGWSRFAFTAYASSSQSVKSAKSLFSPCATGDQDRSIDVKISWEVSPGSADFMQKIRLNPGFKRVPSSGIIITNSTAAKSVVKTALPLPGPPLGNSAFPQEAYFEIIILPSGGNDYDPVDRCNQDGKLESDKVKLIQEDFNAKVNPETLIHVTSAHGSGNGKVEEFKPVGKDDGENGGTVISVGLTVGGPPPLKFPGSYPGSIGFNSNGSVFLDGIKLVFESENGEWGRSDSAIGCGYNPPQKKVFFTVNSVLVHEIHCKSEEFGAPLYPTLAANSDITVLVNLGQCAFKYAPANSQRTPNPCFIGPVTSSPVIGYDDSRELFSMGRIDAQWLARSATKSSNTPNNNINRVGVEFDEESEGDLFEIVLDSSKSPMTTNTL